MTTHSFNILSDALYSQMHFAHLIDLIVLEVVAE